MTLKLSSLAWPSRGVCNAVVFCNRLPMVRNSRFLSTLSSIAPALLLVAAVVVIFLVNMRQGSWCRSVGLLVKNGRQPRIQANEKVDNLFLRQTPTGNVWLQFEGFQPGTRPDEPDMEHLYYRGNYAIHPRRIYVAQPSKVVDNGQAMAAGREFSTESTFDAPDVRWYVKVTRNAQVKTLIDVQRVK
jgi:hypothetical protein